MKSEYKAYISSGVIRIIKIKGDVVSEQSLVRNKITESLFDSIRMPLIEAMRAEKSRSLLKSTYKQLQQQKFILTFGDWEVDVSTDDVSYQGRPFVGKPQLRIEIIKFCTGALSFGEERRSDFDIDTFVAFLARAMENPSAAILDELYSFLSYNDIKLSPDGYILAYKMVQPNFKDCYTGKIDNSVGQVVKVPRSDISDDRRESCAFGLHAASLSYLRTSGYGSSSGNRLVVLKIDPKDVVSVPYDYNGAKMRVCEYEVLEEVNRDII